MSRTLAIMALAMAIVATVTACGSSPQSPVKRAQADARTACVSLLGLGRTIDLGESVLSSRAAAALVHAHADADAAFALDPRWSALHDSVRIIETSLLSGQRTALQDTLADFAAECAPALGVRVTS